MPAAEAFGEGGGKGGGGGGRTPFEAENSLRSKASGQFMDVLSEGPILGLANGLQSVFFNDTPVQNSDGTFNFKGVNLTLMAGLPNQAVLSGFEDLSASPSTTAVGVQLKQALGPVVRTIAKAPVQAVRISLSVPALYKADKKSGDINPSAIEFQVQLKVDNGAYSTVLVDTISGKNTAPYKRDYKIPLPNCTTNWTLQVQRNTADNANDSALQNDLYWDAFTLLTEWPLVYPDTAYMAVGLDAELFGNQVPSRSYEINGLQIKVPANYDPVTRVYTGVWDGTFKLAWTCNPAWIFYDLLSNTRYGLGAAIPEATIDKWSLYTIAQYCDELVPDGNGGTEPRFTFNGVLNSLEDAYSALQSLSSCFRGMIYYGAGVITATQDSPAGVPVKLVTNANVLDGVFSYEGSSLKARHTVANVVFTDTTNNWKPGVEVVEADDGSLARWGHRPVDIQAVGVTSRSQARRIGKWLLDSERTATETVTYRAGLDHADLRPGDVIGISDRYYSGLRMGGRVVKADTGSVVVDSPITIVAGFTHNLRVTLADGTVAVRALTNAAGAHTVLTFAVDLPFSNLPQAESVWQIDVPDATAASGTVAVRQFRVLQVAEIETAVFAVTALLHDELKYARVELGLNRKPPVYSTALTGPISPPTNPTATEYLSGLGVTSLVRVDFGWTASTDRRAKAYQCQAVTGGQVVRNEITDIIGITFNDLTPGLYTFQVRALGGDGNQTASAWAATGTVNVDGKTDPPTKATSFSATGAIRAVVVRWTNPDAKYLRAVEVWAGSTATWSAASKVGEGAYGQFIHSGLLPNTTWYYWLRAVDIFGQPETVAQADFLGPVSATTSYLIAADIEQGIIDTSKFAQGIKPVVIIQSLAESAADGTVAVNAADNKLYIRKAGAWQPMVEALGPNGTLTSDQIADLNAAKLTGTLEGEQFPPDLRPIENVAALPSTANFLGRVVFLQSDGKIYRWTSSSVTTGTAHWATGIAAGDISGTLTSAQFPPGLRPMEVVSALPSTSNFQGRTVFLTTDNKQYRWVSTATTGTQDWSRAVDGGDVTAGTISANAIAANTITSEKMVLADFTNRVENPNFQAGNSGWVLATGATILLNAAGAYLGTSYLRIASGAVGGAIAARNMLIFPVIPGEKYYLRATAKAFNAPHNLLLRIRFMFQDKATLLASGNVTLFGATDTDWTTRGDAFTAPTGCTWAWVDFVPVSTLTGSMEWRIGEAFCSRQNAAEMIVDGAITANKITAGAVQTDKLDAGAVTAAKIGAGEITASKLAVVPQSLNADPFFQEAASWTADAAGWQMGADPAYMNAPSHAYLSVAPGVYGAGTAAKYLAGTDRIPVTAGEKLAFRALGRNAGNRPVHAQLLFLTAASAFVSAENLTWAAGEAANRKEVQATVPATATQAYVRLAIDASATAWTNNAAISDIQVVRPTTASMIVDGSVIASKIAAGAVTTEKLSVGPASGNMIWNSCLPFNSAGWAAAGTAAATSGGAVGHGLAGDPGVSLRLYNRGTGYVRREGLTIGAGQYLDYYWAPDGLPIAVDPSAHYEFSARVQVFRCNLRLTVAWYNGAGAYLTEHVLAETPPVGLGTGGTALNEYTLLWGKQQAPAGAARAQVIFRLVGLNSGASASGVDPLALFTMVQFCPANANQTQPTPWAPGGITEIQGGQIRTNAIVANHINAGSVFGDAGVFNSLKAGIASFGGLTATEIKAGELNASHMAAQTIIAQTIQVADLVVGTSKIASGGASEIAFQNIWQPDIQMGAVPGQGQEYLKVSEVTVTIPAASDGRTMVFWHNPGAYIVQPSGGTNYSDMGY